MNHTNDIHPHCLFWCDVETTGLDPEKDDILEIAWIATEFYFPYQRLITFRDVEGLFLIKSEGSDRLFAGKLDPVVQEMHEKNGLKQDLFKQKSYSYADLEERLMLLSAVWDGAESLPYLAGFSPKFDLTFVQAKFPTFAKRLHGHRVFDASTISTFTRSMGMPLPGKHQEEHRAMADTYAALRRAILCGDYLMTRTGYVG